MHANSVDTMIKRLETPPINLSSSLIEALDVVCIMSQTKAKGKDVRRVREIVEIVGIEHSRGITKTPFKWDPANDSFLFSLEDSHVFKKLMTYHGISKEFIMNEFNLRSRLLISMYNRKIFDFKKVQEVISEYYKDPKSVLRKFEVI